MQYAIVDIETTGGYAAGSGITEIAILIHDGVSVIERFETLINPQRDIPVYIQTLTGIDDYMVRDSPTFAQVASKVYELLADKVFVAHNVNFDYSFIRHHLGLAGIAFDATKLCTVRLARKIKPGLSSYSLGKLCDALQIPLNDRHRAGGDAAATAVLFSKLLAWDVDNHIGAMFKKSSKDQTLPPHISKEIIDGLPKCPGVYYFKDRAGKVLYVGKAKNIQKRVCSHFTGNNVSAQRQAFLRDIYAISFEKCGTELMAFLLEAIEIKRLWPRYNRAMKRNEPKFGLYAYEDLNGYMRLAIGKHNKLQKGIHEFDRQTDGINFLNNLIEKNKLCPELSMFKHCEGNCAQATIEEQPQCNGKLAVDIYNHKVQEALASLPQSLPTFAIMDEGRDEDERSCIWIEKGSFYGMGYVSHYSDVRLPKEVKESLTVYEGNHYMLQMVYTYAQKYPYKVLKL